jgi:hypothetical protein
MMVLLNIFAVGGVCRRLSKLTLDLNAVGHEKKQWEWQFFLQKWRWK